MTTRTSIQMRNEANELMNNILQASVTHEKTVAALQKTIEVKEQMIGILLDHMGNLFNTLQEAYDSDEKIFVDDELAEIVDAIRAAGMLKPEIRIKREGWIEKMNDNINSLPF